MNAYLCKQSFLDELKNEERAEATLEKYERDIRLFLSMLALEDAQDLPQALSREGVLSYKKYLKEHYAPASTNSMLVAMNRFLAFIGRPDLRVRLLRAPRLNFRDERRELNRGEYMRLLKAAKTRRDERLFLLMETICSTGIRVSEHRFITAESLHCGYAEIENKGRTRTICLEKKLCRELKAYCKKKKIKNGPIFLSAKKKPLSRCAIWKMMKDLGKTAGVSPEKIFPHNLRHLFAVTFYSLTRDIAHLADLLGHASIDTTRIYTSIGLDDHRKMLGRMKLLLQE